MTEAEMKIEEYYSAQCESIIAKAHALSERGECDEAIASLMQIPNICSSCFEKANDAMVEIYRLQINRESTRLLHKAKNAWSMDKSEAGAQKVMSILSEISPESEVFADALELCKEIAERLSVDKEREWQQKVQEYEDRIALERQEYSDRKEMQRIREKRTHTERMATIAAARELGKKWAENQPRTNVYLKW